MSDKKASLALYCYSKEDFEKTFTASQSYDSNLSLNAVQEELVTQMVKDITDQIFNATVANW